MPVASERDVRAAIASGSVAPLYLLVGDDGAGKAPLLEAFEGLVEPESRAFDLQRYYADEAAGAPVEVVAAARTLSFFGARRVVVVMRAEAIFKPKGRQAATDDDGLAADGDDGPAPDAWVDYLARPVEDTTVVFVASDVNRTLKVTKELLKKAIVVEFWGLKSDREARAPGAAREAFERAGQIVIQDLREAGISIDRGGLSALLEHAGTDIATLRNSVTQLVDYAAGRTRVTAEDVLALVKGTALINDWALVNAIADGDAREALSQLSLQLDEGRSPFQIHGMIGWWIRERLAGARPQQVGPAVEALLKADLDLKSSADARMVLERLVIELCPAARRR